MPENYSRETNAKNNCGRDCRNSSNSTNSSNSSNNTNSNSTNRASNKNSTNEVSNKSPMSKQNAAQRKTEDCGR